SCQRPSFNRACHRSQPPAPSSRSVLPQTIRWPSGLTLARTSLAAVDTTRMPSMPNSDNHAAALPAVNIPASRLKANKAGRARIVRLPWYRLVERHPGGSRRDRYRPSLSEVTMSTPRYAVIGHPVAHSLSPFIHAAFSRQTRIPLEYVAIDAAPDDFDAALAEFTAHGGVGANVTLPHKRRAASICGNLSERARRAGVVNTLVRTATGWDGDNTDGVGLVRDLTERHGQDLRSRKVLLIGAGGAAHG